MNYLCSEQNQIKWDQLFWKMKKKRDLNDKRLRTTSLSNHIVFFRNNPLCTHTHPLTRPLRPRLVVPHLFKVAEHSTKKNCWKISLI